jgi:hypothetical protein
MTTKTVSKPAKAINGGSKRIPSVKRLAPVRTLHKSITEN